MPSEQQPNDATRTKIHQTQLAGPARRLPLSLLGEIVYNTITPIARIHRPATASEDDHSDPIPKECFVADYLDHIEFDGSALSEIAASVVSAYPQKFGLVSGLDPGKVPEALCNETVGKSGSNVLVKRCLFVGEVLEFGPDGRCVRCVDTVSKKAFWETIRSVGRVAAPSYRGNLHLNFSDISTILKPIVGRIIVVETITPEILVALHAALQYYFSITTAIELYTGYASIGVQVHHEEMLRGTQYRTRHYTIKFLYVVYHEERRKLPNRYKQQTSVLYDDKYPADEYIGRGTTVIQLSERNHRDNNNRPNAPFQPWQILVIPAIPSSRSWSQHRILPKTQFANALEAWLWIIWFEHRKVWADMTDLFRNISNKVSPPYDFMFDLSHIDKLIFDDAKYTKSKLYFWAYQSLEMIQSEMMRIIRRWEAYRPEALQAPIGLSKSPDEAASQIFAKRIQGLAEDMDACIQEFRELIEDCKTKQREIAALRDGLFNGSAVLESRNSKETADQSLEQTKTAIAQGENIKALTLVSIFFLPLAFVTSVFGMTHIPDSGNMSAFAIVLVCVCFPAYTIIGSLMNTQGMELWRESIQWLSDCVPESWRRSKYQRGLSEIGRETFRAATWPIEPAVAGKKRDQSLGSNPRPTTGSKAQEPVAIMKDERVANTTNEAQVAQHQDPPATKEAAQPTWRPKLWNRHTKRADPEQGRDVDNADHSHAN
ncbi:hypothetical protein BDV95DRAFT_603900 [Massariosphaeria phaeospora]|uniref:Cora-like Mg2+ transporter protein-domain-containing protein n=1 Tax=Massariosphaeria phaeospora TaxID=100035 RepID=A0A7C8IB05_9PLEO|nr:hypothetical protein BDV95DRAFT_603900 [Massariosphaeria phaeospora]